MKIALITALCTLGCLLTTAADSFSHQLSQATARVIAESDITGDSIPVSKTGVLLSKSGKLFTIVPKGEVLPKFQSPYIALFPVYMDGDDKVDAVKVRRGTVVQSNTPLEGGEIANTDTLITIQLMPAANLPAAATILHNEDARVKEGSHVYCYSYTNALYTDNRAVSDEWRTALAKTLSEIKNKKENQDIVNQGQLAYLMTYMQPKNTEATIGSYAKDNSVYLNNFGFDEGDVGAPAFYDGKLYSMVACTLPSDNRQTISLLSTKVTTYDLLNEPSDGRDPKGPGTEGFALHLEAWQWALIACAVVLIVLLVVVLKMMKKKHRVLFILCGEDGTQHRVTTDMVKNNVLVGRSRAARVNFAHPTVSGKHAILTTYNGRVAIVDQQSTGGTYVNNDKLTPGSPRTLHVGDEIKLAQYRVTVRNPKE